MTLWVALQSTINSVSVASDMGRHGIAFHAAEPWLWEFSGGLSALLLLWPVLAFDDALRHRLRGAASRAAMYLLGSVAFSVAHVVLMVGMREIVYRLADWHYDFGPWPAGLVYEYRKDAFSFLLMVAGAAALRGLQARAAAALRDAPATSAAPLEPARGAPPAVPFGVPGALPGEAAPTGSIAAPPTFIVRSPQGDLLVRVAEIDWVEAQGNYVALHVGGDVRLLRQTLAETEARLKAHGFIRTHRRSLVNRQQIALILPPGPGEPGVRLRSGAVAPLSESRRAELLRLVLEG